MSDVVRRDAFQAVHYPDHIVTGAYTLLQRGYSNRKVEAALREAFPNEPTPSRESIRQWDRKIAESCQEEAETREQRIIAAYDDSLVDAQVWIAEDPSGERAAKNLMALNAVRGTMMDKQLKRGQGSNPTFMVRVRTAAGDIIETGVKQ